MNTLTIKISITLFLLGLIGVVSLLLLPLPPIITHISSELLPYLALINPTILLMLASIIGSYTTQTTNLHAYLIEACISGKPYKKIFEQQVKVGIIGGLIAGTFLKIITIFATAHFPESYKILATSYPISPITKFLYGGITEEILLRWGCMSGIVWGLSRIFKGKSAYIYWIGIVVSAMIFALAHLPAAYALVKDMTLLLITYIIVGNAFFGIIAGYLFWQCGLEAAMFAHVISHLALIFFS